MGFISRKMYMLVLLCVHFLVSFYVSPIVIPPTEYTVSNYMDMAERQRDFILDAWQVGYAGINPSMIRDPYDKERTVMVWRRSRERNSKVGYMWLNSNWNPMKDIDVVEALDPNRTIDSKRVELLGEDPRIFSLNSQLILVYNVHHGRVKSFHYADVHYHRRPLHLNDESEEIWKTVATAGDDIFYVQADKQHNIVFDEDHRSSVERHQKNWSPFEFCPLCVFNQGSVSVKESGHYRAQLLFSYSLQPHVVVQTRPIDWPSSPPADLHPRHHAQAKVNTVAERVFTTELLPEDEWQWGEMRGGTPALLVGDSYLAFFHSSGRITHRDVITYVMGAYMFQRDPPFAITHISPEPLIQPSMVNETLGWAYKVVDYIIFPMGFTYDDRFLYLSYGKNDKTPWILKFEKEGLIASLKPVKTKIIGKSEYNMKTGEIFSHSYANILE